MLSYTMNPSSGFPQGGGLDVVSPPQQGVDLLDIGRALSGDPSALFDIASELFTSGGLGNILGGLGLGGVLGHTSTGDVSSEVKQRFKKVVDYYNTKNLSATDTANGILYSMGWLNAMYNKNYIGSSSRMKGPNMAGIKGTNAIIGSFVSSLESSYTVTSKKVVNVTFPTKDVVLGSTRANQGQYFVVQLRAKTEVVETDVEKAIKTGTGKIESTDSSRDLVKTSLPTWAKWMLILAVPFGALLWLLSLIFKKK